MKKLIFSILIIALVFGLGTFQSTLAEYPERPINLTVGFRAGGAVDTMGRLLAKSTGDILGQPMLVLNKAGAGGGRAVTALKNAKPDGYNLCFVVGTAYYFNPHAAKTQYTLDDFTHITSCSKGQEAWVTSVKKPFKDWQGMIAYAREKGVITAASFNPIDKLYLKIIAKRDGINISAVPTKGGAGMVPAVLGGHVDFGFSGGIHYSHAKSGKMRVLAGMGSERLRDFPDAPTMKELGYNIVLENYFMISGPKGLPKNIAKKLNDAFVKAIKNQAFVDLVTKKMHFPIVVLGPDELPGKLKELSKASKNLFDSVKK
ncbi:MAG: tripartite tricarboxylate transporter substrate binding protein [Deltaproteobacteria bacterium]|nr:tripartite tricarboxylate transporter substrate binding protein [Deltaproteobacteria bacterium]